MTRNVESSKQIAVVGGRVVFIQNNIRNKQCQLPNLTHSSKAKILFDFYGDDGWNWPTTRPVATADSGVPDMTPLISCSWLFKKVLLGPISNIIFGKHVLIKWCVRLKLKDISTLSNSMTRLDQVRRYGNIFDQGKNNRINFIRSI